MDDNNKKNKSQAGIVEKKTKESLAKEPKKKFKRAATSPGFGSSVPTTCNGQSDEGRKKKKKSSTSKKLKHSSSVTFGAPLARNRSQSFFSAPKKNTKSFSSSMVREARAASIPTDNNTAQQTMGALFLEVPGKSQEVEARLYSSGILFPIPTRYVGSHDDRISAHKVSQVLGTPLADSEGEIKWLRKTKKYNITVRQTAIGQALSPHFEAFHKELAKINRLSILLHTLKFKFVTLNDNKASEEARRDAQAEIETIKTEINSLFYPTITVADIKPGNNNCVVVMSIAETSEEFVMRRLPLYWDKVEEGISCQHAFLTAQCSKDALAKRTLPTVYGILANSEDSQDPNMTHVIEFSEHAAASLKDLYITESSKLSDEEVIVLLDRFISYLEAVIAQVKLGYYAIDIKPSNLVIREDREDREDRRDDILFRSDRKDHFIVPAEKTESRLFLTDIPKTRSHSDKRIMEEGRICVGKLMFQTLLLTLYQCLTGVKEIKRNEAGNKSPDPNHSFFEQSSLAQNHNLGKVLLECDKQLDLEMPDIALLEFLYDKLNKLREEIKLSEGLYSDPPGLLSRRNGI